MYAVWMTVVVLAASNASEEQSPVSAEIAVRWAALSPAARRDADDFRFADHWRRRSVAAGQLKQHGDEAVVAALALVEHDADDRVRRDAFEFLRRNFADHPRLREYIVQRGLTSSDSTIRQESLWHVGTQRWTETTEVVWRQLANPKADPWVRWVAAKSLGEFGDVRALGTLVNAVQHDRYYPRHYGNIGLKSLCGKCLTDFGYEYGEGAFVSVVEVTILNPDPFAEADRRAKRYAALRDFLQWLQKERPEMYASLTTQF